MLHFRALFLSIMLVSALTISGPAQAKRAKKALGIIGAIVGTAIIADQISKQQQRPGHEGRSSGQSQQRARVPDEDVRNIQEALAALGYDVGQPDGFMGKNTRSAIKAFQSAHGYNPTGNLADHEAERLWQLANQQQTPASPPSAVIVNPVPPQGPAAGSQFGYLPPPPYQPTPGATTNSSNNAFLPITTPDPAAPPQVTDVLPSNQLGSIELNVKQIEETISDRTLKGMETSSQAPVHVYFGQDRSFKMIYKRSSGEMHEVSGTWMLEPEANNLCTRVADGNDGKGCWIVRRGASLEMVYSKGSIKSAVEIPTASLVFTSLELGDKLASK